jgi:hypothetical protein
MPAKNAKFPEISGIRAVPQKFCHGSKFFSHIFYSKLLRAEWHITHATKYHHLGGKTPRFTWGRVRYCQKYGMQAPYPHESIYQIEARQNPHKPTSHTNPPQPTAKKLCTAAKPQKRTKPP